VLVTVIPIGFEGRSASDWFARRLLNFRFAIAEGEALPVTSTWKLRRLHLLSSRMLPKLHGSRPGQGQLVGALQAFRT
jgi:hypothetical protein